MLLRNSRVIERPIRMIMAANAINNVSEVNDRVENSETAMTTASPQEAEKAVGPSSEISIEHGQVIESVGSGGDELQIIGHEINDNEQTVNTDKAAGPGEKEKEVENDLNVEKKNSWEYGAGSLPINYADDSRPRTEYR